MKPSRQNGAENAAAARPLVLRYAVAALCMAVAIAIRYLLTPWLGEELPFMLCVGAALVAAWYGGAAAGAMALLVGLFLADSFFLRRTGPGLSRPVEFLDIFRYLFTASLGIVLIEVLHHNRRNLEREIAKRKASEAQLVEAHHQLRGHARELDRRVAERTAQLTATVEALRNLLYYIAHNFRAPLRAVRGYSEILGEEYGLQLDSRAREYFSRIADGAERMDALIHDLLEYGRLGHVPVILTSVNLESVVERALAFSADLVQTSGAEVQVVRPLPAVCGNAEVLQRVVGNLLENSLKFVRPRATPHVCVRAETRGSTVRLWVEDDGIGIESRYHERIFGPFETLYPQDAYEGTGIGLAIVKEGVERMEGRVGLESEPGSGSRFWIELPAASAGRGAQAPEEPHAQAPVPMKGGRESASPSIAQEASRTGVGVEPAAALRIDRAIRD